MSAANQYPMASAGVGFLEQFNLMSFLPSSARRLPARLTEKPRGCAFSLALSAETRQLICYQPEDAESVRPYRAVLG